ncbi:hypothetical protein EDD80_11319 [Anseongella ginsenosidimutans]|uniref:Uncharacterized protein n=1 Tax=Anseongella ginsenosidimutans TaxID=496056 RepID=A0A4R3KME6_9SPHI|nr:hypothetical protein [Anseongella ginsenosidimutans]QEC52532.1 hypothetical protein FRZ59_09420 [Anseongella ginsenosidimutans]TCS85284.1 hypothetical protein EDD80_11319 [Anseongella ginsenosidimutans]
MRVPVYIIIASICLSSCADWKINKGSPAQESLTPQPETQKFNLDKNSDSTLAQWAGYYEKIEPGFSLADFELTSTDSLRIMQGNVLGSFDQNFEAIYEPFLIFNPDKSMYLDFDSNNWGIDESGEPSFSPDQEVNLVDMKRKTVSRLTYRGPSQWVEDAFWENDSTIILLENGYEKQPVITKLHLSDQLVRTYTYTDTLDLQTNYTNIRFRQKGINVKDHEE